MRTLIVAFALVVLAGIPRAHAQQADITGVITSQIEALKADDFATAFTFAHPSIQGIFGTPENFGRMVAQGYPMVWRPAEVDYLPLREENGRTFQDVQIVDQAGRVFVLEYSMTQTDAGWRISGVRILEQSALST